MPGDVIVEREKGDEIWVVSTTPARVDEVLTLDLTGAGQAETVTVRVVDSSPVLVDGIVRHGLRLTVMRRA